MPGWQFSHAAAMASASSKKVFAQPQISELTGQARAAPSAPELL